MQAEAIWNLFLETGVPEYYLMYRKVRAEMNHVPEDKGLGPAGSGLQGVR